jgi:cytoskeleton protein RodZ
MMHSNPDAPFQPEPGTGPGRHLRQARQAHGIEIGRVAAELHLAPALVEAIEQDRYDALPAPVFVVGYLRNYARLFGLDPDPVLQAYRASGGHTEPATPQIGKPQAQQMGSGHLLVRLISLAIIVGLLVLVGLWWQNREAPLDITEVEETSPSPPQDVSRAVPVESPSSSSTGEPRETDDEPPSEPSPSPIDEPSPPPIDEPSDAPMPTATPTEAPPPEVPTQAAVASEASEGDASPDPATPSKPPEIELAFDGPCWVDIRDATREFKLFGEMGKGDRRVLGGTPPYSIIIGNAAVTTITIDGEPFDLASRTRGNVARFELDPTAAP